MPRILDAYGRRLLLPSGARQVGTSGDPCCCAVLASCGGNYVTTLAGIGTGYCVGLCVPNNGFSWKTAGALTPDRSIAHTLSESLYPKCTALIGWGPYPTEAYAMISDARFYNGTTCAGVYQPEKPLAAQMYLEVVKATGKVTICWLAFIFKNSQVTSEVRLLAFAFEDPASSYGLGDAIPNQAGACGATYSGASSPSGAVYSISGTVISNTGTITITPA